MSKLVNRIQKHFSRLEIILMLLCCVLAIVMIWRIDSLHLTKALTDQNAHLNFARLTFDSMTPGFSQIGFWPPLLHLILSPFTLLPVFYNSGFAAVLVLLPCLIIASIFLFRTMMILTNNKFWSFFAAVLFLANPYILYYSTTPMMEVLFLANLFGVAYFLARWFQTRRLSYLLLCALFISLASLSRYEGLILIPIVSGIVFIELMFRRKSNSEIQALLILFGLLAFICVAYVVTYGLIFAGNPLAFMGGTWLKTADTAFPTRHNLQQSVVYLMHASYYMLTRPLVWLCGLSLPFVIIFSKRRFHDLAILLVLISPLIFIFIALFSGSYSIAVPELPPYGFFNNDRYGLTWIGFAIAVPTLFFSYLTRLGPALLRRSKFAQVVVTSAIIISIVLPLYKTVFAENFETIKNDINVPKSDQVAVSEFLRQNYDYGKILVTRADNDPILAQSNIPLKDYIFEGNYRFFDQSLAQPWLFARFVIMHNPNDAKDSWSLANEAVARTWGNSSQFMDYYDLVLDNATRRVYKINDAKIRQLAAANDYDPSAIPSINQRITRWDPGNIYNKIEKKLSFLRLALFGINQTFPDKSNIGKELKNYYYQHLRPEYGLGFVSNRKEASSESQSYAMLQSYLNDDPKLFDRTWNWTRNYLQIRSNDKLFAWKYDYGFFLS